VSDFWAFFYDPQNRDVLAWLGGGFVVIVGGLWAAFKYFRETPKEPTPSVTITADRGGVASGRDSHVTSPWGRKNSETVRPVSNVAAHNDFG
jgi:hypothetical protein